MDTDRFDVYSVDSYLTELESEVVKVTDDGLILKQTIFYPRGGGQPEDKGLLVYEGKEYPVQKINKGKVGVALKLADDTPEIPVGSTVNQKVDWDYRYQLMKHHTSLHILSAVVWDKFDAKVTGGTIYEDKARLDFDLQEFSKELAEDLVTEVNDIIAQDHEISISFMKREEAEQDPDLIRTKVNLLPDFIKEIRVVRIGTIDAQADGGLHVKKTSEIGKISLVKTENKGKGRKRITISAN